MSFFASKGASALLNQAAALLAATVGGAVFNWLNIPAPWLSGGMLVTGILAATGQARPMLRGVREFAMILAGVSLGTGVTPETVKTLASVPGSLALLAVAIVVIMACSASLLVHVFKWSRLDAMLASAPGALSTVLVVAVDEKANVPRIATVQLFRLVMLVAVMPSLIVSAGGAGTPTLSTDGVMTANELLIIFAASLPVALLLERGGLPAPLLLGGMLATGALTGSGLVEGHFPSIFATLGFLLIGCFIGERFRGLKRADAYEMAPAALASFFVTTTVAGFFAALSSMLLGAPVAEAVVAFAPGGLEAMSILALALHLDPVYVAAHHLARFLMVGLWMPIVIRFWPALFGAKPRSDRSSS